MVDPIGSAFTIRVTEMDVEKNKMLLIAYALGQMTAYGMTVSEQDIHRQIKDYTRRENIALEVTQSDVKDVTETLYTLRVIIRSSTHLPYG